MGGPPPVHLDGTPPEVSKYVSKGAVAPSTAHLSVLQLGQLIETSDARLGLCAASLLMWHHHEERHLVDVPWE